MHRTLLLPLLAALMLTPLTATAEVPDDQLPDDAPTVDRVAGDGRYETAAKMAVRAFSDGATTAVLATGRDFPDALAAGYLARIETAPILLTEPDFLPQATQDVLDAWFEANGSLEVVLAGGTAAISQNVEDLLKADYGEDNVRRVRGGDRIETAVQIANQGGSRVGTLPDLSGATDRQLRTAIVSVATSFPDALAAGPLSYANEHPILLTYQDRLPEITRFALQDGTKDIEQVLVVGGTAAVSASVENQIRGLDNIEVVHRIRGEDRTETAAQLAALTRTSLGWDGDTAAVAVGTNFPDALSLAPLAATVRAPLYLTSATDRLGAASFGGLQAACAGITTVLVAGGSAAVSADAARQTQLAARCADHVVPLTGDAEVQDGHPDAGGTAWVALGADSVCYGIEVDGLDGPVTAAHFHEAPIGEEGEPVAAIDLPDAGGYVAGCVTGGQVLRDGWSVADFAQAVTERPADFYVNLHTDAYPAGAVRGQVAGSPEA